MFVKSLFIANFRCIKEAVVNFSKGLNVIIGENASGKTTVLDALRLALSVGNPRRDLYVRTDDFHIDKTGTSSDEIAIDVLFGDVNDDESAVFAEMLTVNGENRALQLNLRFSRETLHGIERIRPRIWGGDNEGQVIQNEVLELLYHIYLGALRDAERELAPGRGNRLSQLFLMSLPKIEDQKRYALALESKVRDEQDWQALLKDVNEQINHRLDDISLADSVQKVAVDFIPYEFRKIVENLKMMLPIGTGALDSTLFELSQNSMGYNNLIYMATAIGDLLKRRGLESKSYTALLIEEPEAHLHPQLQDSLFGFFDKTTAEGVQVFLSTHSPTVTAKPTIESLIRLQATTDGNVKSVALVEFELSIEEKNHLRRFLDVTKSQLFFAKSVILVEGISEALLLPVLALKLGLDLDKCGVEIVNIGGVAFAPFARLFNNRDEAKRLDVRCSVVTDKDPDAQGNVSPRAVNAQALAGAGLRVYLADHTLEYELYEAGNQAIIGAIYGEMHPRTQINSADDLVTKLGSNKDKADLAQLLSGRLMSDAAARAGFNIPAYLENAIKFVATSDDATN